MLALGKKNVFFHPSTWVDFFPSNPAGKVYSNRVKKKQVYKSRKKEAWLLFFANICYFPFIKSPYACLLYVINSSLHVYITNAVSLRETSVIYL